MRKLVVVITLLAALGLAAPPAQAAPILVLDELGFKSSIDGRVYDTPYDPDLNGWPPTGAMFSPGFLATGLGTVTYTFNSPGTHYVAGFFDYHIEDQGNNNAIYDEEAWWSGGALPAGWSGKSDDPWEPINPPPLYDEFSAFDALHPFGNWAWNAPGHDVAVAYGYAFTLDAGDPARSVVFAVSNTEPVSGYFLQQVDPLSGQVVYFSGFTTNEGEAVVPEPGTLTLVGLGLAAFARRLRRR